MTSKCVEICVRIKDFGDRPMVESPWAEPVLATDFGGDYRLLSDLFLVPLHRGDIVRCEVTEEGSMQVVDVLQILPGLLLSFEHPPGTDATVKRVMRAARSLGYQVRRPFDTCVQFFIPGGELDRDIPFPRFPESWIRRELLDAPFRMRAAIDQIEFSLATEALTHDDILAHREPDDPAWALLEPELVVRR